MELQLNEVQDLSTRNRECIVKNVNDMGKVLDADFWPEGIMVRRYRTTQSPKWREALTN